MRPVSAGIVARLVVCVVDSWRWGLSCGVVFSGGPCLLDRGGLSSLRAVKRRRSSWEFHETSTLAKEDQRQQVMNNLTS